MVIQTSYNELRSLCEPLLVFQDVLGASGAELQRQMKPVQNRDFPRPSRERGIRSLSEPVVGEGNEDTLWTIRTIIRCGCHLAARMAQPSRSPRLSGAAALSEQWAGLPVGQSGAVVGLWSGRTTSPIVLRARLRRRGEAGPVSPRG